MHYEIVFYDIWIPCGYMPLKQRRNIIRLTLGYPDDTIDNLWRNLFGSLWKLSALFEETLFLTHLAIPWGHHWHNGETRGGFGSFRTTYTAYNELFKKKKKLRIQNMFAMKNGVLFRIFVNFLKFQNNRFRSSLL